jgi:hypothetical protein
MSGKAVRCPLWLRGVHNLELSLNLSLMSDMMIFDVLCTFFYCMKVVCFIEREFAPLHHPKFTTFKCVVFNDLTRSLAALAALAAKGPWP